MFAPIYNAFMSIPRVGKSVNLEASPVNCENVQLVEPVMVASLLNAIKILLVKKVLVAVRGTSIITNIHLPDRRS